jgi:hypothetical protein
MSDLDEISVHLQRCSQHASLPLKRHVPYFHTAYMLNMASGSPVLVYLQ